MNNEHRKQNAYEENYFYLPLPHFDFCPPAPPSRLCQHLPVIPTQAIKLTDAPKTITPFNGVADNRASTHNRASADDSRATRRRRAA